MNSIFIIYLNMHKHRHGSVLHGMVLSPE